MQKSFVKYNRSRGRLIYTEIDPLLGELHYSEPAATQAHAVELLSDPDLGSLVLGPAPAMRALPHRTGPPRPCSRAKSGER